MITFIEIVSGNYELKIQGACVRKHNLERYGDDNDINLIATVATDKYGDTVCYIDKYWLRRNKNLLKSVRKFLKTYAQFSGDVFDLPNYAM